MAIITISRGSYSKGKEVAEGVAEKLGYDLISRDLILEASQKFNIPEVKMVRAIHDGPGILDRFGSHKRQYVSFFQSALLERVKDDNVVYHGLAGHFLLQGISHVFKVRIVASIDERAALEAEREKISVEEAKKLLKKDDEERRKWGMSLYGMDSHDPSLYDMVLRVKTLTVDDAVDIISHSAKLEHFQKTDDSQATLENMLLSAQVRNRLVDEYPEVEVSVDKGEVLVKVKGLMDQEKKLNETIKENISNIPGVKNCSVDVLYMDV